MSKSRFIAGLAMTAVLVGGVLLAGEAFAQKANKPAKADAATPKVGQKLAAGEGPLFHCFFDNLAIRRQLKEKLKLTDDQTQKIHAVLQTHKDEIASALTSLNDTHKALLAAVRADKVDETAIKTASAAMGTAIGNASVLRAKVRQEVMAILTPEQRTQIDEALDAMQQNKDEAVGEMGGK